MFGGKGSGHAGRFTFPEQHAANNSKTPPGLGVEQESTYPFNCWKKDLITWAYATDLDSDKQAHAVVLRLTGTARVLAQEIESRHIIPWRHAGSKRWKRTSASNGFSTPVTQTPATLWIPGY